MAAPWRERLASILKSSIQWRGPKLVTIQRRLKLTFRATTRKQAEVWQQQLHTKLVE